MSYLTVAELLADLIEPKLDCCAPANAAISAIGGLPPEAQAARLSSPPVVGDPGEGQQAPPAHGRKSHESQESQPTASPLRFLPARWASDATWDDADMCRFSERRARLMRWGWTETEAEALAERLVRRDLAADDRVVCTECLHYKPSRCSSPGSARLRSGEIGRDWAVLLQRCPGFTPMA